MTRLAAMIQKRHRVIIAAQTFIILFFAFACTFHDTLPICHYLFGCDHGMH